LFIIYLFIYLFIYIYIYIYKYRGFPKRKLRDDDLESKLICDSDEDVEDAESDEDEDYYSEEERNTTTSAAIDFEVGTVVLG
jgi:phage terminase Nu1 subunit (DNA packaging protein)